MTMVQITPFVPCTRIEQQIEFYSKVLGFSVGFKADNYAFLRCDKVAIRLVQVDNDVDLHRSDRQQSIYIDVDDVDALYMSIANQLKNIHKERVKPPFNQDYGQREFHIIDEDCTLIYFGQSIKSGS
ncbi:MAG: VOC family protein [Granulosicoccus sp.]